ncbi:MAG TPA: hypothetical protein VKA46_33875 [Gemmataceae bacterium]|nr:hypothetical protein [Gemmataceae bacterium]
MRRHFDADGRRRDSAAEDPIERALRRHAFLARHFQQLLTAAAARGRITPRMAEVLLRRLGDLELATMTVFGVLTLHSTQILLAKWNAEEARGRLSPEAVAEVMTRPN